MDKRCRLERNLMFISRKPLISAIWLISSESVDHSGSTDYALSLTVNIVNLIGVNLTLTINNFKGQIE